MDLSNLNDKKKQLKFKKKKYEAFEVIQMLDSSFFKFLTRSIIQSVKIIILCFRPERRHATGSQQGLYDIITPVRNEIRLAMRRN